VRGGGHSTAGHGVSEGGIVLDLKDMKRIDLDIEGRTVWAGAGLTAAELTEAVGKHGLVIGFGDTGSVGISGITLGGGIGFLVRKYGLTIDNLLAAEIVTADGQVLQVDSQTHPDLFWAIRGGGGNFGVVTRFQYRLHRLDQIVGGMLILPATPETISGFLRLAQEAPEELSTIANVMPAPPMPMVPESVYGQMIIFAFLVYAGPVEDGLRAVAPFRALAEPIADMIRPMRYPEMYPPEEGEYHPTAVGQTLFLDQIDRDPVETILKYLQASDAPMRVAQLRALGGAMARVPADATAFSHRTAPFMVSLASFYMGPEDKPRREAWLQEFLAALTPEIRATYVNFLGEEGPEHVQAAYLPANWKRLCEIKRRYDPTNLFHINQNIPPAVE
jgi:FAD/FMN-containing dehydrogenase